MAMALGAGVPAAAGPTARIPGFSGAEAMALLRYQCDLGPRIPGSPGNRALQDTLLAQAEQLGLEGRRGCFQAVSPLTGKAMPVCNVVITIGGVEEGPALWLGAHFDTRPICDHDPDPERRSLPLPGANDGASGVAVLWQIMNIAADTRPPRDVVLMFFDGEDSGRSGDPEGFCLGSAHLVEHWRDFGSLLPAERPRGMILLDMVGDADLGIPQEGYSLAHAPDWTAEVFGRAAVLGLPAFTQARGGAVYDDHIPFLRAGIPAVDLIDFDYPAWHTSADVPAACSPASLEQVGRLLVDLIYNP